MKKGVIAILLLLAAIVIVSPGIVGRVAENSVDKNLNWAADQSADFVVKSDGFDRGWFSSQGQHRIEMGEGGLRDAMTAGSAGAPPVLVINTRLDHGLIPVSSMSREQGSLAPGLGSAVSTLQVEYGDGKSIDIPGTIYSDIGLAGAVKSKYVLEAGSQTVEDGSMEWQPGQITVEADPKTGKVSFDGKLGKLSFDDGHQAMFLDGLAFSGEQTQTQYGFAVGDMEMTMGEMSVGVSPDIVGDAQAGGLKHFSVNGSSAVDDGVVTADALFAFATQDIPGFGGVSVAGDLSFAAADAEAFGVLSQRMQQMSGTQDPGQMMMGAEKELKDLFAAGLNMNIKKLDVELPMGTVETKMNFELPKSDAATYEWTTLLLDLVATVDLKVPEALVDLAVQMNPQASMVVGMGYLKKNGDIYELNAAYKQAVLTVNGAPIPIPLGMFQ